MKALFFPKSLIGLILMSFLFASCGPLGPSRAEREAAEAQALAVEKAKVEKAAADKKKAASRERARVKANKEAAARRARLKKSKAAAAKKKSSSSSSTKKKSSSSSSTKKKPSSSSSSTAKKKTTSKPVPKPPVKPKDKYRTATAIPGKPGFVFNPWTNKAVDVRGIPGGSVVRDPNDGDSSHKFRVP